MNQKSLLLCCLLFLSVAVHSQKITAYKNYYPAQNSFPVVEGQAWMKEVKGFYDRLPARAEQTVRKDVWNLSKNSAGLYIKFTSNTNEIIVRYTVENKENFAMPHMPSTGVSGIDLYAITLGGKWVWAPGTYKFGDTIEYHFSNLEVDPDFKGRDCEFRVFLPLYNTVSWMEISAPADKNFSFSALTKEKPIVVYGTSIAQGGCASRPGLGWTNILERKLDRPLINLAFAGNGRLEKPLIDLMNEIDASLYVLDCLPNVVGLPDEELASRLTESIKGLRAKHPTTPILIVDHSLESRTNIIDTARNAVCEKANKVSHDVFEKLNKEGMQLLFQLTGAEIGLDIESTVDGVHPNDIGMEKYAAAYANTIHKIFNEPEGNISTTKPVVQTRDGYDWRGRHEAIKMLNETNKPQNVIIGNSIIHYWAGEPVSHRASGVNSWKKYFEPIGMQNMGYGWDRVENVLWRIYHGELDGFDAKHIFLMIGTNNLDLNTDDEIVTGMRLLLQAIKLRQPKATIFLSGIFPRRDKEKRVETINLAYAKLASELKVVFINPGKVLLNANNKIDESLFSDGLHPNEKGYDKLAPAIVNWVGR